ncbi:hypothetical protein [Aquibacillus albus]|uniref:2-keto-3-deoxy-6-phosphogluconate aldolase n=1 Tax=Aquibacillus albus TaxID=1168171 RepID=A0ABS2MWQ6_9BACI|nr:hypothetical protein [Aquibacillus albus]MBM7570326.1 2-keto-3-deoxy-6-phosphogluconate aldolase [Aquibacillus albus]
MAVGGVSLNNAEEYLRTGWDALGLGGSLINQQLVSEQKFDEMEEKAKQFIELRNQLKE